MKLLMITRKVDLEDSSPAGFTYNWVKKIGEKLDKLYVITWQKSNKGNLPENIEIISLPNNKLLKLFALKFQLLKILPKIDGVFCHQNPEYTILSAPLAKFFRKKIISWHTHGSVNWKIKLVNFLTDKILTASENSCRLKDRKKIKVVGHGIDTEKFIFSNKTQNQKFTVLSVGRISPTKDYETLIKAVEILVKQKEKNNVEVKIVGGPVLKEDKKYFEKIQQLVRDKDLGEYIKFLGSVSHNEILSYYQNSDLFINLSQTGSIDKAVLEAMACGKLVLTSNEAFNNILKDKKLMFESKDFQNLANKIINLMKLSDEEKKEIEQSLRKKVIENHNLDKLVIKILKVYEK